MLDLDAYLERIGHGGDRAPTLDTLRAIARGHTRAIPFENLDPVLRRPVRLDAPSLERKLVREGRGGYCFEHNLLLRHVLEALGYRTTGLAARVLWNQPEGRVNPRSHMLLRVEVEGASYVVDTGFGGQTLTAPLRLEPDVAQATPHGPFRLRGADGWLVLEAEVRGAWAALYRFDLTPQEQADHEVTSWYLTHHPDSHFLNTLVAARTDDDRRYALRGNELAIHHLGGDTERRTLDGADALRAALETIFLLRLPDDPRLDDALARVASGAATPPAPAAPSARQPGLPMRPPSRIILP